MAGIPAHHGPLYRTAVTGQCVLPAAGKTAGSHPPWAAGAWHMAPLHGSACESPSLHCPTSNTYSARQQRDVRPTTSRPAQAPEHSVLTVACGRGHAIRWTALQGTTAWCLQRCFQGDISLFLEIPKTHITKMISLPFNSARPINFYQTTRRQKQWTLDSSALAGWDARSPVPC